MKDEQPMFRRLALIGLGLIGSSIARAARRHGLARQIVGMAPSIETRVAALKLGLVDRVYPDAAAAVTGADLAIICAPLGAYGEIGRAIAPALAKGAILSDVGSVKVSVVRDLQPLVPPEVHFIPGHPVAGTEQSGPEAGFAELFIDRWCILTPLANTDPAALEKLTRFWTGLGCQVEIMAARHHDLVLAITSHVPHLIAYNIVATAADLATVTQSEVIKYSAGGFRDFTRIAASDPVMWRDIFLNNREAVLEMLGRFGEDLTALQRAIRWADGDKLYELFVRTRAIRRAIIDAKQEVATVNFGRPNVTPPPAAKPKTVKSPRTKGAGGKAPPKTPRAQGRGAKRARVKGPRAKKARIKVVRKAASASPRGRGRGRAARPGRSRAG
jgi:cyclohexadieny/prephenate dehydrogenase